MKKTICDFCQCESNTQLQLNGQDICETCNQKLMIAQNETLNSIREEAQKVQQEKAEEAEATAALVAKYLK